MSVLLFIQMNMTRCKAILALSFVMTLLQVSLVNAQNVSENFKCVAMGKPGSKIKANGEILDLPIVLDKCDGAVPLADETNICYRDSKKQRKCAEFKKNQPVSLIGLNASAGDGISGTILSMVRGDVQTLAGQTRSTSRPSMGLPFGPVVAEKQELELNLALDPKLEKASSIQIYKDGSQEMMINLPLSIGTSKINISNLPQDVWYRWVVDLDGKKMSDRFLYVGNAMNSVRSELDEINQDTKMNPQSKAYLRAEILNANGLVYERILVTYQLKQLSK